MQTVLGETENSTSSATTDTNADEVRLRRSAKRIWAYHFVVLIAVLFVAFVYKCPFQYLFRIPCPGCGITRAYLSLLRLDFRAAFEYHPLFFAVAPMVLYVAHRNVLKRRLSGKTETIILIVILVLFIAVYIYRLLNNAFVV